MKSDTSKKGSSNTTKKVTQSDSFSITHNRTLKTPIKVMVQSDHLLFLEGFGKWLNDWGCHATHVKNYFDLKKAIETNGPPDILLLEYYTANSHFELNRLKRIIKENPTVKLILKNDPDPNKLIPIEVIKRIGIVGIIDIRYHSLEQVKQGIFTVYLGGTFFDKGQNL